MSRLFGPVLAILLLGSILLPQTALAKNNHASHRHKARHVKHHHHHRTGA